MDFPGNDIILTSGEGDEVIAIENDMHREGRTLDPSEMVMNCGNHKTQEMFDTMYRAELNLLRFLIRYHALFQMHEVTEDMRLPKPDFGALWDAVESIETIFWSPGLGAMRKPPSVKKYMREYRTQTNLTSALPFSNDQIALLLRASKDMRHIITSLRFSQAEDLGSV